MVGTSAEQRHTVRVDRWVWRRWCPGEAGVPAVNAVRLVVGGGWLPGFSITGVRVQAGGGRRLGWHVPRAAAPP